jgi:hypothetical protein
MENLYELVFDLLGKDESHELFKSLPAGLEDQSVICFENEQSRQYLYPDLGLVLLSMRAHDCFVSASLHLTDSTTEFGNLTRYQGWLPKGIKPADGPDEVEARMAQRPIGQELGPAQPGETLTLWTYYRSGKSLLGFGFGENKLRQVSLTRFAAEK